ncbi:TonB family protein [Scytonema sp. PCC 10023]|uniref:TonB family protein n=1 Tax=Scytonema sp. PCC 10023 TaxID=1680591 RepID=UPI0039C5AE7E
MGFTGTALEQRGREARALRTFLALSLIGSLGLHLSVLASGIVDNFLKRVQETNEEPIEFVVVDPPAPKPVAKPIEPVKPLQQAPKPKIVEPIKPQPIEPPKPVLPQKTVVVPQKPLEPLPPVLPKQTVVVPPKPPVQPKQTVIVPRKPPVQPQKIVTAPVQKPIPKPQPEIHQPTNTLSKPEPAPKPQADQNLKRTLRDLQNTKASQGGGGGGGGGNSPPIATGSGDGTLRSGTGTGTGIGTGSGSGIGSGTGSGIGSGSGSGIGSGIGSGSGSGIGSGIGSGTGSGQGSGTGVATAPKPRTPAPSQLDFADCVKCDVKYPERAKRRGIEGRPGVAFDVDNNGNVNNVRLVRSSGHKELDEALLEQARDFKLNSAAAGRQNVQLFANFAIAGSRNNQEARQRQRERQERLEAQRRKQQEAQQRNPEAVANEEETSGRRRRAILTTPETAPQTTPETGTRRRRDIPSAGTESTTEQTTPQPVPQLPEQNSSFEQNGQQPPDASTNQNDLREQLRLRQNQSQPSEAAPSGIGENNE